jgi:ketosteroid isomerase-like protein
MVLPAEARLHRKFQNYLKEREVDQQRTLNAKQLYEDAWALVTKGDFARIEELCAPGYKFSINGEMMDLQGMMAAAQQWTSAFSDFGLHRQEVHVFNDGDDKVCVFHDMTTMHDGDLTLPDGETIRPTRRETTSRSVDVVTARNGKLTSWEVMYDEASLMRQLKGTSPRM